MQTESGRPVKKAHILKDPDGVTQVRFAETLSREKPQDAVRSRLMSVSLRRSTSDECCSQVTERRVIGWIASTFFFDGRWVCRWMGGRWWGVGGDTWVGGLGGMGRLCAYSMVQCISPCISRKRTYSWNQNRKG